MPTAQGLWETDKHSYLVQRTGNVYKDGVLLFRINPDGRVTDRSGALVLTVKRDGRMFGPDGKGLGKLSAAGERRPDQDWNWFWILSNGTIEFRRHRTSREIIGFWNGCRDGVLTCSVVTHLVLLRDPSLYSPDSPNPTNRE